MACHLDCYVAPHGLPSDMPRGIFVNLDSNINKVIKIWQFWKFEDKNKFFQRLKTKIESDLKFMDYSCYLLYF